MANLWRLLWLLPIATITAGVGSDAMAIASNRTIPENAIAQGRIRAPFFEETQDAGFTNTFLGDALGGVANPLETGEGNGAETINMGSDSLQTIQNNVNRTQGDLNGGLSPGNGIGGDSIVTPGNGIIPTGRGIFRSLPPSGR